MYDCFISYGRKESLAFVHKLSEALAEQGLSVWFDKNDIPLAVDFQEQINDGILRSHNFLFIISPHAIQSPYVKIELELALRLKKRIIPVLHVEPTPDEQRAYLHPKIAKLNWVFFREGIEAFDTALSQLLQPIGHQIDFVRQHTEILTLAQLWKDNQRRTEHLLFGPRRRAAQQWLELRFDNDAAPVEITNLQCEYLARSRWLAEGFASDVYIIAANDDAYWAKKLKFSLLRFGKTVADRQERVPNVNQKDIVPFHLVRARYVVYLVSAQSVDHPENLDELALACRYQKPIVRLLLDGTKGPVVSEQIGEISFVDVQIGESYRNRLSELLLYLEHEADYFRNHQKLLRRAANWVAQKHNPAVLLHSNLLQMAQVWLETARYRQQNRPVDIQERFIEQSALSNPDFHYDLFIGYHEADYDYAWYLNEELMLHARTTWFEHNFLSKKQFRDEVFRGIERSANFACVLTRQSVRDLELRAQIGHAQRLRKRILLISFDDFAPDEWPSDFSELEPVQFSADYARFRYSFSELIRVLNTDRDHVRQHTLYLSAALKWEQAGRKEHYLLATDQVQEAMRWYDHASQSSLRPEPSPLQREFIEKSKQKLDANQRNRRRLQRLQHGLIATLLMALGVALFFGYTARQALHRAQDEREKARLLYNKASANNLVALARQFEKTNPTIALRLAEKAYLLENNEGVVKALYDIYKNNYFYQNIGTHSARVGQVRARASGVLSASDDHTARLWDSLGTERLRFEGHRGAVTAVDASPQGLFLTASADKSIRLWAANGKLLKLLNGHDAAVNYAEFSADGKQIISAGADKVVVLWDASGSMQKILTGHQGPVHKALFVPNSQKVISFSEDNSLIIWDLVAESSVSIGLGGQSLTDVAVSADGRRVALAFADGKLRLIDPNGQTQHQFVAHFASVLSVAFAPDQQSLLTTSADETIGLWTLDGTLLATLRGHEQAVNTAVFSADGRSLISGSADRQVLRWDISGVFPQRLGQLSPPVLAFLPQKHTGPTVWAFDAQGSREFVAGKQTLLVNKLNSKQFAAIPPAQLAIFGLGGLAALQAQPDSDRIVCAAVYDSVLVLGTQSGWLRQVLPEDKSFALQANNGPITALAVDVPRGRVLTGSAGRSVKLWHKQQLDTLLSGHNGPITALAFADADGAFASAADDGTIRLYSPTAQLRKVFIGHDAAVERLLFSHSGKYLASFAADKTVRLWETEGYEIRTIRSEHPIEQMAFDLADRLLYLIDDQGRVQAYACPVALADFRRRNRFEQLTVAQMLDLKIMYHEELHTEPELLDGARFFRTKASLQPDKATQIRFLVQADSLFDKLIELQPKASYLAEHLQVLLQLHQFHSPSEATHRRLDALINNMLKTKDEADARLAAAFLVEKAQVDAQAWVLRTNLAAAAKLYRKLYLQYPHAGYLVQRFMVETMAALADSATVPPNQQTEYFSAFVQTGVAEMENAAQLLVRQAQQTDSDPLRLVALEMAEKLFSQCLQQKPQGQLYAELTQVLFLLQDLQPSNTAYANMRTNLAMQLQSIKKAEDVYAAAEGFIELAERERGVQRKTIYLDNAYQLLDRLYAGSKQAKYLVATRRVLLAQRRNESAPSQVLRQRIDQNLAQFAQLDAQAELQVAIAYLDRELGLIADRQQKVELLGASLGLLAKLMAAEKSMEHLGRLNKVWLQLRKLDPENQLARQYRLAAETAMQQLDAPAELQTAIDLFAQWASEGNDPTLQLLYTEQQADLYLRLLARQNTAKNLIRAWSLLRIWPGGDQAAAAQSFRAKLWQSVAALATEAELNAWAKYILEQENGADQMQIYAQLGEVLCTRTWTLPETKNMAYRHAVLMAENQLLQNAHQQAALWAERAQRIDTARPQAQGLLLLLRLETDGLRQARDQARAYKKSAYNGRSFASFFEQQFSDLERRAYQHPELNELRRALRKFD